MKIKYMGTSDVRVLPKGENFGGQLADPLAKEVRWTTANNHLVDSDEAGLSPEAVELLLALDGTVFGEGNTLAEGEQSTERTIKEFKDVTDLKVIPPSLHQSIYLGLGKQKADEVFEGTADTGTAPDAVQQRPGRSSVGSRGGSGGTTTTVGGSTDGAGGDTT